MIIKKFTGKTEKEATDAAKKELGDGIVIMNVRNVKKKGLAGIFGAKQTEVTVALEEERKHWEQRRRVRKTPWHRQWRQQGLSQMPCRKMPRISRSVWTVWKPFW